MTFSILIRNRRPAAWVLAGLGVLGAGALLLQAFNPQPDTPKVFGLVGLTPFDGIRLNVTNVGGALGLLAPPCRIQFGFADADGAPIRMADATISDGHSASIALTFAEASAGTPTSVASRTRVSVRPVVKLTPPDPCFTAVSGEVTDAFTGRTNLYMTPEVKLSATGSTVPTN